ncbi:MAG TPA: ACP S-malonyltransferase [Alcanivoracaceae bacterium]|nr:ACP S-malonyltransferase [Alcanivoracaceae bacterium]
MTKTAFIFPGQGSQSVGMLAAFRDEPVFCHTLNEASGALGYDLWEVIQEGPADELQKTEITQPALLTAGVALWRLWEHRGGFRPHYLAGHSLGEYTALTCAGVFSLGDAVRLVRKRGELMQEAVPAGKGAMAAVLGLDDDKVIQACADSEQGEVVAAANFNSPGQVVIAGETAAVERAIEACKEAGARRAMALPVSVPSHCALMRPAAEQLEEVLSGMLMFPPEAPVINNVDVAITNDVEEIRSALIKQLYSPVRWVETVQLLQSEGVTHAYECGPGKVLAGLIRRIDKGMKVMAMEDFEALKAATPNA